MKKSDRQNALAVAAVALCFMLTLGLTYFLGGEGFLAAFNQSEAEVKRYLLCGGAYESAELARSAAELVKSRGGAGYVLLGDSAEVVLSVYASEEEAEGVLAGGSAGAGAYIKEVAVGEVSVEWAPKELREDAERALGYFDIAFECLSECADGIETSTLTLADVATRVAVCRARWTNCAKTSRRLQESFRTRAVRNSNSHSSPQSRSLTTSRFRRARERRGRRPLCAISACSSSCAGRRCFRC